MAVAQLVNNPATCVADMLDGVSVAFPGLEVDLKSRTVLVREKNGNVAILSGGGSGHEPFAAGYVGKGMLTAAVAGAVFASPPSFHIQSAIRGVATPQGVLVIIPNYTGDCLNFGLAIEKTRSEGLKVEGVIVGEDCSLEMVDTLAGKRGMCGLLFVFKICGGLSSTGRSLQDMAEAGRLVVSSMATIGVGLRACRLPGREDVLFDIAPQHMELGLGVHGEAGLKQIKAGACSEVVTLMLEPIKKKLSLSAGDDVTVLVNNLGGLSQLEQWVFTADVNRHLSAINVNVLRVYVGHLMTSLDMVGIQVSVLKIPESHREEWLRCLDSPTDAPAWPGSVTSVPVTCHPHQQQVLESETCDDRLKEETEQSDLDLSQRCLLNVARSLIDSEEEINRLDSGCGDGDCGSTLRRLGEAVGSNIRNYGNLSMPSLLQCLSVECEMAMGGTSGAIYSLLLTTAASVGDVEEFDWASAWSRGLDGVMRYSHARPGDRTLLDALVPACAAFSAQPRSTVAELKAAFSCALQAAQDGCAATSTMTPRAGRASYVQTHRLQDVDAGARGVCVWLDAINQGLAGFYETS